MNAFFLYDLALVLLKEVKQWFILISDQEFKREQTNILLLSIS